MSDFSFDLEKQKDLIGQKIGTSGWVTITQEMIDTFGKVTLDEELMHNDPEWAKTNTPYGTTISYGFLTLSILTHLFSQVMPYPKDASINTGGYPLNYGFDKIRIIAPVPVDGRVRAHFALMEARERAKGQMFQKFSVEMELEGREKPVLYAEWLSIWITKEAIDRVEASQK